MTRLRGWWFIRTLAMVALAGCGGAMTNPTQRVQGAEEAIAAARGAGASTSPVAELHLRLAEEQYGQARALLAKREDHAAFGAALLLSRAQVDAQLALALTREDEARIEAHGVPRPHPRDHLQGQSVSVEQPHASA